MLIKAIQNFMLQMHRQHNVSSTSAGRQGNFRKFTEFSRDILQLARNFNINIIGQQVVLIHFTSRCVLR
jgi:hypothetical protein